jgi:hypothetical protein
MQRGSQPLVPGLEIFLTERLFSFAEMRPEFVGDVP